MLRWSAAAILFASPMLLSTDFAAAQVAELPSGNGPQFRSRMMDWSTRAEPLEAEPVQVAPVHSRTLPRLSSRFGERRAAAGGGSRAHAGIDIPGPLGTPVRSAAAGTVRFAGTAGGYGTLVVLQHGNGLTTRYAHLSRLLVSPGTAVAAGEAVGLMGSTGHSTGSHLHFEVRRSGTALDPITFLTAPYAPQITATVPPAPPELYRSRYALARTGQPAPGDDD